MQWFWDFLYQWITIFLFAVALGFMLYFLSEKDQAKMLWSGFAAWVLMGAALAIFVNTKVMIEPALSGVLIPSRDADPQIPETCGSIEAGALKLFLGDSLAYTYQQSVVVLRFKGKDIITISRKDKGILLTAKIYSTDGRIVAAIVDNEFAINPNNFFRRERPDKHTLIIYDQQGDQVLKVRYINPSCVYLLGEFRYERQLVAAAREHVLQMPGVGTFRQFCFGATSVVIDVD